MDAEEPLNDPVLLEARHDVSAFDCGVPALNNYLRKFALANQRSQAARTYVATRGRRVVGRLDCGVRTSDRRTSGSRGS